MRRTDGQYRWLLRKAKLLSDRICVHPTLEGTVQGVNACFYAGLNVSVRRVGAGYGDGAIDIMVEGSIRPSLLHQDPRYFYQGTGTSKSRALHVLSNPFICRGDNRPQQPNYSTIGGDLASAALANAYSRVESRRGAVLGEISLSPLASARSPTWHRSSSCAGSRPKPRIKTKTTADREATCLRQSVDPALTRVSVATFYPEGAVKPGS